VKLRQPAAGTDRAEPVRRINWPRSKANAGRPLAGVKVLDLTRVLAGPFAAMHLGDLGADVIKIESPSGDETRRWGPPFFQNTAAYYFGPNRNKWGAVLDLNSNEDRAELVLLLREADVILQNFTGPTARKFGVDYLTVSALNPRVIHLSLWATGPEDPERNGYDVVIQALTGLMAITGEPDGEPVKVGVPISDLAAGLYSALAVSSALVARSSTGRGMQLDVSLYDSVLSLLANQSMSWLLCGEDTRRLGSDHPTVAPYGRFRTSTDSLVIAVGTDRQFQILCSVLEVSALAEDVRFRRNADRVRNRLELRIALEQRTRSLNATDLGRLLDAQGIPSAVVRGVGAALDAPETRTVSTVDHGVWGRIRQVMNPIRIGGQYLFPYLAPPALGEHSDLVRAAKVDP
jgi:glutaryl-CoA transferase